MNCSNKDCRNKAECALALCVPAKGHPITPRTSLRAVIGLPFCGICAIGELGQAQPNLNFKGSPYRKIFTIMARGKCPPDFDRAYMERVEFDSAEWRALTKGKGADGQ